MKDPSLDVEVSEIQEKVYQRIHNRKFDDFAKEYNSIIEMYLKLIDGKNICSKEYGYKFVHNEVIGVAIESQRAVLNGIRSYLNGDLANSYTTLTKFWYGKQDRFGVYLDILSSYRINKGEIFYRIRDDMQNTTPYKAKEMFHIPFQKRHLASINRFTIPGYPALYMSRSVYTAWEEMQRPPLESVRVSKIEAQESVTLLDLRLWRICKKEKETMQYLRLLPLIIACSMAKTADSEKSNFKQEYIISQMVVHSIMRTQNNRNTNRYQGIIYNSTRFSPELFGNEWGASEDIVVPVEKSREKGYCPFLAKNFFISDSVPAIYPTTKACQPFGEELLKVFNRIESELEDKQTIQISNK